MVCDYSSWAEAVAVSRLMGVSLQKASSLCKKCDVNNTKCWDQLYSESSLSKRLWSEVMDRFVIDSLETNWNKVAEWVLESLKGRES